VLNENHKYKGIKYGWSKGEEVKMCPRVIKEKMEKMCEEAKMEEEKEEIEIKID
jgi:hypothetical protein